MRIAYGINGYGRGHAVRSLALLSELRARHEVLVLTGGDAVPLLAQLPMARVPGFGYAYRGAKLSVLRTVADNASLLAALSRGGGPVAEVERILGDFGPDVIVSDSEPLVLRAGERLGVPRVGLDHVGIIAWCRPRAPLVDGLLLERDAVFYRLLMGAPERVVVSSFFGAPARRTDVTLIPPVLRERVLRATPRDGGHLLVYFNRPQLLTREVLAAVAGAGVPAVVYGAGHQGRCGDLVFKPISEEGFVEDLASARAVFATSGHQLASEALHLGKPMLLCPEASAEQRLNARELVRLGAARALAPGELCASAVRAFVGELDRHRVALTRVPRDGNARALEVLEAHFRALTPRREPGRVVGLGAARRA